MSRHANKPSGCFDINCAQTHTGQEPVVRDHAVVRYKFRPDIVWSDGEHLTAGNSKYAYEIAASLFLKVKAKIFARTFNHIALDQPTIVWETIPGNMPSDYVNRFFPPLPEHTWVALLAEELLQSDMVNRKPLGWGAYPVAEWVPGSHISLNKKHMMKRLICFFHKKEPDRLWHSLLNCKVTARLTKH